MDQRLLSRQGRLALQPHDLLELSDTGYVAGHGSADGCRRPRPASSRSLVVVWGTNPVATHVNLMTHAARARKERGATLVVVDPYRNATAEQADMQLALRPGTDGALACAVMHVLFRDGYADRGYLARYGHVPASSNRHLATRRPSGRRPSRAHGRARSWPSPASTAGPSAATFASVTASPDRATAPAAMHAVTSLPVVSGAWQHRGRRGALQLRRHLGLRQDDDRGAGRATTPRSVNSTSPVSARSSKRRPRRDLGDGPPVTGMFIQNANPVSVAPNSVRCDAASRARTCSSAVHEQVMTDTATMADMVLPATMFLEHDDVYQAAAHPTIQVHKGIFAPSPRAARTTSFTRSSRAAWAPSIPASP